MRDNLTKTINLNYLCLAKEQIGSLKLKVNVFTLLYHTGNIQILQNIFPKH